MIKKLFGLVWWLAKLVYRVFAVLILLATIALIWFAVKGGPPITVDHNVALIIAPSGEIVDQGHSDAAQRLFESFSGEPPQHSTLRDMLDALDAARKDDRIRLAVLKLDGMTGAGLAQLDELRAAVERFREAGKQVVAYAPSYDQKQYYAASSADEIVIDPLGMVMVEGLSTYRNYFADALARLGVDIHVFRVGEYKSAVEPYVRNDMSVDAREAEQAWLGDLWGRYGANVAASRDGKATMVEDYVNGLRAAMVDSDGDAAAYALGSQLVTHVETLAQFRERMAAIVGEDDEIGSFRQIHYLDYLTAREEEGILHAEAAAKKKVALVVVEGEIVDGYGDVGQAGGDEIAELLDEAQRDEDVAAVVLRVNSPGGSVTASEEIRRQVQQLREAGKPVVASMSSLAASGGYWVSMDAERILAHETTITGSIGVFGLIPTLDRSLAKIGVHTDGVGTTALAGALRLDRPMNDEVAAIVQASVNKIYRDFIGGVAAARKLPVEKVDEIARGRVWSGQRALELGLVDAIGDLQQAADQAAELAGLADDAYTLEEFTPVRSFAQELMLQFGQSRIAGDLFGRVFGHTLADDLLTLWQATPQAQSTALLRGFNDPRGVYALCDCELAAD